MTYNELKPYWDKAIAGMDEFINVIHQNLKNIIEDGDEWEFKTPIVSDYCTLLAIAKVNGIIVGRYIKNGSELVWDKPVQPWHANYFTYEKIATATNEHKDKKVRYVVHKGKYINYKITVTI